MYIYVCITRNITECDFIQEHKTLLSCCCIAKFGMELPSFPIRADNPKHFYTNHQCDKWDKYKTT